MSEAHDGHPHDSGSPDGDELSYYARRAAAMESLLVEKGVCSTDEIGQRVREVDSSSPADGARVVARAWIDPEFKKRLLTQPGPALAEFGYDLPETTPVLEVVENTEQIHYMVVCTLCSCYPRTLLGRPPDWYKSLAYRSRAVVEPRNVMREFGFDLDDSIEVKVLDSTADLRYLVLPRRPAGTEGLSEEELAKLVSRDSMIGVSDPLTSIPSAVAG